MGKRYPKTAQARAIELYFDGFTLQQVRTKLHEEGMALVGYRALANWRAMAAKEQEQALARIVDVVLTPRTLDFARRIRECLEAYRIMRERGLAAIGKAPIRTAGEASALIDRGIRGERDMMQALIETKFVMDVFNAVVEEVPDTEMRNRIGMRLREILDVQSTSRRGSMVS